MRIEMNKSVSLENLWRQVRKNEVTCKITIDNYFYYIILLSKGNFHEICIYSWSY